MTEPDQDQPVLRTTTVVLWAAAAVAVTVLLTSVLLLLSGRADQQRLGNVLDIVRIGLSVGVGTGGLFALWLASRRQRSTESTLALQREVSRTTVADSTERRITEQYNKAIEQLGHEHPAVRIGGLYSLERVAQHHPSLRQTVVDVLCGYLRLPFTPPGSDATAAEAAELEVRNTVQSLFWEHLGDPGVRGSSQRTTERYWPNLDLDLSRAVLVQPILRDLYLGGLKLEGTEVHGTGDFSRIVIEGVSAVGLSTFHGPALLAKSQFRSGFAFIKCQFEGVVNLMDTTFDGPLAFIDCLFRDDLDLAGFQGQGVVFRHCQFGGAVRLDGGRCQMVFIDDCDFQGEFTRDELDAAFGVVAASDFVVEPGPHSAFLHIDGELNHDNLKDTVRRRFGVDLPDLPTLDPRGPAASA